eukprot:CAMPEP_0195322654 /NCGR_PEP_ID=MMETSP0708-20121125/7448_1 /TAXON_ID=33640 /ORGANISM="Asterionellopsis glacialis, Strain CCMP134" /LENGTH=236 /DNA_ID=CAMNT_0040389537 /DNA_START=60 /DNA_END=767 /DNA_ORIENTATION=-
MNKEEGSGIHIAESTDKPMKYNDDSRPIPMNEVESSKDWKVKAAAGILVGSTIFGTLALTAPFVFLKTPLPYMATPGHKIRKALQSLPSSSRTKFVDLGSGDGEAVLQAVSVGYKKVVGVELNSSLWMFSKLRLWRQLSYGDRQRTKLLRGNLFDYNLNNTDAVLVFGVRPLMNQISQKLAQECRPGTHVLSYRFQLPLASSSSLGTTKSNLDQMKLLNAKVVYDEEEMRIYKCLD